MSKFIDLTGKVFGQLTVIERTTDQITPAGIKQARWVCRCECGMLTTKRSSHLRTGSTTSCGTCYRQSPRLLDLSGQCFGRLRVVNRTKSKIKPNGKSQVMWLCLCDCGSNTTTSTDNLRSGRTQSCGCLHRERAAAAQMKDVPGYGSMHERVRKSRGPASANLCVDCGDKAHHWSCRRDVPHVIDATGYYSTDIMAYDPRCWSCHKHYDFKWDHSIKGRGRSKLTPDQVRSIRTDQRTAANVAIEYGVSPITIGEIRRRVTWRWLE